MILEWPQALPRPERESWQLTSQDARRKRQSDAGPPAYRRRFSSASKLVSLSLILTRNERAIFDNFFHHECAEGARLFWMPDPTTEGWSLLTSDGAPLLTADGAPMLLSGSWLCSWGDQIPTETILGIEFRKSFNVVVLP
ncbi:hypothetical protein [Ochrobactrum chromiisoli]|uniref:Uncharacterized protein n=1 Tax=Ochrobactrum chromiisoli TaxID=2993941 RepID=A0ABT3QN88_9HYPH|nr:hypothetical protein [Ochrobactrum chromiisoli]MCX2697076.1 hypothetical protein [Ochrobactrum chromiisoli]